MLNEFKKFIMRGNVFDMAVGIVIGTAFGAIVKSLVNDVIMPPIGLLLGKVDFSSLYVMLKAGDPAGPYASLVEANDTDLGYPRWSKSEQAMPAREVDRLSPGCRTLTVVRVKRNAWLVQSRWNEPLILIVINQQPCLSGTVQGVIRVP